MTQLAINGGTPIRTKAFPTWPIYGEQEKELLLDVFNSGLWGGTGRIKLPVIEQKFAQLHGAKHAVTVVNGTIALTVAAQAAGIKPGDEVIITPYTFFATAAALLLYGAIPVFADIDPKTLLLDPASVESRITPRTRAIIPVHLGGAIANMTALKEIAKKFNLVIIEDAAQAVGATWKHQGAGTIGDLGTFSFQSSKNINAGEGGMILTNHEAYSDLAWSLVNAGRIRGGDWYQHENIGWNLRMTEFQAAILIGQFDRLEEQMQLRAKNAELLTKLLRNIEHVNTLEHDINLTKHAYHLFLLRISSQLAKKVDKATFSQMLNAEGIPLHVGYHSLNKNEAIQGDIYKWTRKSISYACPQAELAAEKEAFWLPQNVLLGDEADMHDIAAAFEKVIQSIK